VERYETHANLVFLAGSDAWKIKREVHFPYLDFPTLEGRHAACMRKVEVNRHLAPELYVVGVPIMRSATGWREINGPGEVIEWCCTHAAIRSNRPGSLNGYSPYSLGPAWPGVQVPAGA